MKQRTDGNEKDMKSDCRQEMWKLRIKNDTTKKFLLQEFSINLSRAYFTNKIETDNYNKQEKWFNKFKIVIVDKFEKNWN